MEKKQTIINNLLINYYHNSIESPYTLIFLHGWRSESKVWLDIINKLNFNAYAIDLPGFGESQLPNTPFKLENFSNIIEEFIKKLNLENIVLIGHSNGGAVSIKTVLSAKVNIERLILVDSAGIRTKNITKTLKKIIAKIVKPIFSISFMEPFRKRIYISMGSEDYIAEPKLKGTFLNMISEDLSLRFSEIKIPTLIIWGDKDRATPLSNAEFMHNKIQNSKLKIIPNTEHFSFLQNLELFTSYIQDFLNE